ncbi:sensor histidine kinase [Portibacter lacus]|uniref:histidine kinase n=1 Tax=Portibacter lacus TaxID=1099794 RepID=A0AA37STE6_9BACT|nr:HAMP domain-containing sensor histidine kinase [Portibacter lacus]GLR17838.1 two-component sensor histidine kinase [Portibacter lacus]
MELYKSRSKWRILLAIFGMIIVVITSFYSYYLAQQLGEKELKSVKLFALALSEAYENDDLNADFTIVDEIIKNNTVPIVLEDEDGALEGYNFPEEKLLDQEFLIKQIEKSKNRGFDPIQGSGYSRIIYLNYSRLYTLIRLYPIVQFLLVAIFILLGYLVFSASRREEQNRVWAGMAKETAHQLGTPISAIIGWLEHLKIDENITTDQLEILDELANDVDRLNLVADRFSKIGSEPKLKTYGIYDILNETKEYMEKRASRNVSFRFPESQPEELYVNVNKHLFVWVLENLMRNALDAMEGKGEISAEVHSDSNNVTILLSDTGKGIPESKQKTVFRPGYSTKTRGWGLGLSLAKRIIEQYHKGKIFVKNSKLNEGTTFQINLPKASL